MKQHVSLIALVGIGPRATEKMNHQSPAHELRQYKSVLTAEDCRGCYFDEYRLPQKWKGTAAELELLRVVHERMTAEAVQLHTHRPHGDPYPRMCIEAFNVNEGSGDPKSMKGFSIVSIDALIPEILKKETELSPFDFSVLRAYILRKPAATSSGRAYTLLEIEANWPQFYRDTVTRKA